MPVSVLILTYNEEQNLSTCLSALKWCDDIVILDSCSEDNTKDLASKAGIRFYEREFDNYATQRNYGINNIDYKHNWLLMVDADEVVSSDLVREIHSVLDITNEETTLYRLRRKDYLLGRWIRFSSGYPTWFGRLVKIGHIKVERSVNEEYVTNGKIGYLENHLEHFPFNKGFSAWFEKHNRYSSMEAELIVKEEPVKPNYTDLFVKDPTVRRKAIKSIFYRLPGRPIIIFIGLYLFRGGFLDGKAGLMFCILRSIYEFSIDCKIMELRMQSSFRR